MRLMTFSLIGLLFSTTVYSAPVIIYDSGNTLPLPSPHQPLRITLPSAAMQPKTIDTFPVRTPEMTPGIVQMRKINRPALTQPVFIVGADPMSLNWLQKHGHQLKKLNATGIAVNVENKHQLEQLKKAAGGLDISPVSGTAVARQLALSHYPALVSRIRIEQ